MPLSFVHLSHQRPMRNALVMIALLSLGVVVAWLLPSAPGIAGYVPLHTLMETVAIVIAMMIFAVGWNSHNRGLSSNIVLLACLFLAVGLLDFSHMLSFAGMPDFVTASGPQKAIDFWLVARTFAAIALLLVAIRPWRPFASRTGCYVSLAIALGVVTLANWLFLFHADQVPRTFIAEQGLTPFKIGAEYTIIAINIITAFALWRRMQQPQTFNAAALFGAVCTMALSEFFFTLYADVTDVFNLMGHLYKVVSYLFLYRAIFIETIDDPYQKLRLAQQNLTLAIHASNTGLWDWDLRTNQVILSPEWKGQIGYREDEIGHYYEEWESRLHPDDRAQALKTVRDFLAGTDPTYESEFRLRHRDGSYRWILARGELKTDREGKPYRLIGSHIDITQRKLAENELREKSAELERFTYTLSHDLKSPLVTIKTFLGYLKKDMAQANTERIEKDMAFMTKAADKMGQLLDELLEISRAGRAPQLPAEMAWDAPIQEALTLAAGAISQRRVTVTLDEAQIKLHAERARLVQIWQNLIDNAVKFMGEQTQPHIHIGVDSKGHEPIFFLRDNGIGVELHHRDKVFGLFEKLDPRASGTGIGLALVKRIVERYQGRVWLESEGIGMGTCVRFTLPAAMQNGTGAQHG